MAGRRGWVAYSSGPTDGAPSSADGDLRPELADVGRLARRGLRAVIGAARAGERPRLNRILTEHLGAGAEAHDVVEETWPGYDHVNVQAGLDAWLADPRRTWELVGVVGYQHQPFGLGELLAEGQMSGDPFGPRPGNASSVNLACGPDGAVRPCVRCGLYLVTEGDVATAVLLRGPEPEMGVIVTAAHIVSTGPGAAPRAAAEIRAAALDELLDTRNAMTRTLLGSAG